jgi:uncharacterized repeat protein (TIGR01451 family)/fimbrial isopeptide formation D2 family protein
MVRLGDGSSLTERDSTNLAFADKIRLNQSSRIIREGRGRMIKQRLLLILLAVSGGIFFAVILAVGPVGAQESTGGGSEQASTPAITPTPSPLVVESTDQPPAPDITPTPSPLPVESTAQPLTPDISATPPLPPEEAAGSPSEPEPSPTSSLVLTGSGLPETSSGSDISSLAINPVDCATFTAPVVGYEISRGQDPNDAADFINDLIANAFSVGTVNLGGGSIPACVDVLIVRGLAGDNSLTSAYTAADGTLLQSWTASGHGLMLLGDWGVSGIPAHASRTQALFQTYGYSQQGSSHVSDPTDFDPAGPFQSWVIYQTDNFASHAILNGVTSLEFLRSSWLSSAANAIVTTDADTTTPPNVPIPNVPVMAAFGDGSGCVALSTDSNWIGVVGGGYFKQDNARVARQMVQWLNGCTSLKLSKIAAPSPVQVGGLLTYTLTASNDSAATVTNVVITDTVPLNTTFFTATGSFAGPDANGVVTWSLGTLNSNSASAVVMVVQVDHAVPTGALIANTAWVTSAEGLTATVTTFTPVNVQVVDPLVTKAVNTNQAQVNDVVTFTLTVQQAPQSSSNATNVRVVDALPPELDILGVPQVNSGFTVVTGQVITWTIPALAPTDVRLMTIQARVNNTTAPPLTIRNQATLSFDQGPARSSNQVEILVPAAAPTATPTPTRTPTPTSPPPDHQDDDNDNDSDPAPPPATPVPATAVSSIVSTAPAVLPVAYLPETGYRSIPAPTAGWLLVGLACLGLMGIILFKVRQ